MHKRLAVALLHLDLSVTDMRLVVFLVLLSSLLPRPARAQLWRYPDSCAAAYDRWNSYGWGEPSANRGPKPTCRLRPTIPRYDVSPDSVQLVLRCQNHLRLPKNLNGLRFTAEGATVKLDLPQHELLLVPTATAMTLRALRGQQVVWQHHLQAVEPPLPEVVYLLGGCEATDRRPGSDIGIRNLSLRPRPDHAFAAAMPEDVRLRVNRYEIVLLRNGTAVGVPLVVNGPDVNLRETMPLMQAGDQLQIDVKQVLRMNFRGQIEEVPLTQHRTFTLRQEPGRQCLELAK